ncbi:cytochrome P450 [Nonomuraea sp. NN258]|uniref:cytochrome P450 family protein n=1 Tax=Nonomuraea antri TaxID=2730852 RepID=UPI0015697351|nr:cytochrome P450 [Nonomuraea antri]NRQ36878.1 cytochrome P450 [Nonomuraea antri]
MTIPPIQLPVPGERMSQTVGRLRDEVGPVVPVELPGKVAAWIVTSYEAVNEVLAADDTLFSKDAANFTALHDGTIPPDWPMRQVIEGDHLLTRDGADHRRLRGLINRAFTPARVQGLAPRVQELTDELLGAMAAAGPEVDLVRHFTEPLPVSVICELFGVPAAERHQIREWTSVLVSHTSTPGQAQAAGGALFACLAGHIARRRGDPADDLTTALIHAQEDDGDRLTDDEMVWILWVVILAGHETTVHLLANTVVTLLGDPAALARARADDAWDRVVEEALRSRNPVVTAVLRYALKDVEVAGVRVPAGQALLLGYAATGTDPARWGADAARFDAAREPEPHLGFGRGPHFCLGAPLARLEARIALASLFRRFPGLRLAVGAEEIAYTPSLITEGPVSLPVRL